MVENTFESYFGSINEEYLAEVEVYKLIKYGENIISRKNPAYKIDSSKEFLVDFIKGLIPTTDPKKVRPKIELGDVNFHLTPTEEVNLNNIDKYANLFYSLNDVKDNPKAIKHILEHDGLFILTEIP